MIHSAKNVFFVSVIGLVVCLFATGCSHNITDNDVVRIDPNEVNKRLGDRTLVLDARSEKDFNQGHVPSAQPVKIADIDVQAERPRFPGYKMIVVYGQNPGSGAAMTVAKRLMITKHKNVRLMQGGFDQWTREGLPVEISHEQGE